MAICYKSVLCFQGDVVAKATVYDGDKTKTNEFHIWLENDTENILQLQCGSEDINIYFPPSTHYECGKSKTEKEKKKTKKAERQRIPVCISYVRKMVLSVLPRGI